MGFNSFSSRVLRNLRRSACSQGTAKAGAPEGLYIERLEPETGAHASKKQDEIERSGIVHGCRRRTPGDERVGLPSLGGLAEPL